MTKCNGIFGFLFGHKIASQFDEISTPMPEIQIPKNGFSILLDGFDLTRLIEASTKHESKFAVAFCKRCGQQISKP